MSTPNSSTPSPEQQGQPSPYAAQAQTPGQARSVQAQTPPPDSYGQPAPTGPTAPVPASGPIARPGVVTASLVLAIVGGAAVIVFGLFIGVAGSAAMTFFAAADEFGWIAGAVWLIAGLVIVWGALLVTMAIFALRRANWARWVLIVMGGIAVALSLVTAALGDPVAVVNILWIGASAGLLLAPQSGQWFGVGSPGANVGGPTH